MIIKLGTKQAINIGKKYKIAPTTSDLAQPRTSITKCVVVANNWNIEMFGKTSFSEILTFFRYGYRTIIEHWLYLCLDVSMVKEQCLFLIIFNHVEGTGNNQMMGMGPGMNQGDMGVMVRQPAPQNTASNCKHL